MFLRSEVFRSTPGSFIRHVSKPAIRRLPGPWRPRHYCTSPTSTATPLVLRWYHNPWKVAAAVSVVSVAALIAFCHRCLEVVPCTNRAHFVFLSPRTERELGDSEFAEYKEEVSSQILSELHPDSVRVRLIADKIIHAAQRGLGVGSRDAVILRVTGSRQNGKPWRPQPQTSHLHGLNWEVIVVEDELYATAFSMLGGKVVVFRGFLKDFSTDGEIAYAIAHEVGHIIARHHSDITRSTWVPMPLSAYFCKK
ncbi:mitochondrial metalloendopeptidase OMA1-like [Lolium perenne]|uniref:mitochondrial metalloendopeptidase OMA1-like n=1 Tax=Lolium perenne TaxID=4522 RepID=UPI0021F50AAF|nr:mitochondrial metalloendopeptidase OMA1-like [Lolium perenne]